VCPKVKTRVRVLLFSPMPGRWRINLDPIRMWGRWARGQLAHHVTRANVLLVFGTFAAVGGGITIYKFFWIELPEANKRAALEVKRPVLFMRHVIVPDTSGQWIRFDVLHDDDSTKDAAPGFQSHVLFPVEAPIEPPTEAKKVEVEGPTYFELTDKPSPYSFSLRVRCTSLFP
jgi:hypothetical protein